MRVTFDEIARIADVSKTTVSRVANGITEGVGENTRQHVLSVMERLGYDPGSRVFYHTGGTKTIGMIVPDITNPFFAAASFVTGRSAAEHGYTLFTCNASTPKQEAEAINSMISKRFDGIILVTSSNQWSECHERLRKYRIPLVLMDRKIGGHCYSGVFVDNSYAFYMATNYLIKGGHHRIAMLCGPKQASTTQERIDGYQNAFVKCGLQFDSSLIRYADFDISSGYNLIMQMIQDGISFSSVLAGNDSIAVGVMRALKKSGIQLPQDVELIGFDNTALSEIVQPPLSTIKQPVSKLGAAAVSLIMEMIEGRTPENPIVRLRSSLILRGTTRQAGKEYN